MEAAEKNNFNQFNKKTAIETLFSYLDKGIDDMEEGKVHTVDEAFQIVKDKIKNEL